MKLLTLVACTLSLSRTAFSAFTFSNITVTPFDQNGPFTVDNVTNWDGAAYTGDLPASWSDLDQVAFTNVPNAYIGYIPKRKAIFAIYLIGTYKSDRGAYTISTFANGTILDTVTLAGSTQMDDTSLYSLYSITGLDPFTEYSLLLQNSDEGGYLAVQGILQSTLTTDGDASTTDVSYPNDPTTLYANPAVVATGTRLNGAEEDSPTTTIAASTTSTSTTTPPFPPSPTTSQPSTTTPTPSPGPSTTTSSSSSSSRTATGTGGNEYVIPSPTGAASRSLHSGVITLLGTLLVGGLIWA